MYTFTLQDWVFVSSPASGDPLVQGEHGWVDVGPARDVVFWLQVASRDAGIAGSIELVYETAPLKDDSLFMPAASAITLAESMTPVLTTVRKGDSGVAVPIGNWLRWKLRHTSVDIAWSVEFRIFCAVNPAYVLEPGRDRGVRVERGREALPRGESTSAKPPAKCGGCS